MGFEKNVDQIMFEKVYDFFKLLLGWTIGALGLLITAAGILFYTSVSDMKKDVHSQVEDIGIEATRSIERVETTARRTIKDVQMNAVSLAQTKVDKAFEDKNIQGLIQNTAERIAADYSEKKITKEMERQKEIFLKMVGKVAEASEAYTRSTNMGTTDGIIALRGMLNEEDPDVREVVRSYINKVKVNWWPVLDPKRSSFKEKNLKDVDAILATLNGMKSEDMAQSTSSFRDFKILTGETFEPWDYSAVEKWKKNHPEYTQK
jgi:hypothetical protein